MKRSTLFRTGFSRFLLLAALALPAAAHPTPVLADDVPCNIQAGSCTATTAGGVSVEFDIQPKPVTAMTDLAFSVKLSKQQAPVTDAAVSLDLGMPGMYMGKNTPVMKSASAGRYEGKGTVTRCASGRKTWRANVTVSRGGKDETVGFVFEVK